MAQPENAISCRDLTKRYGDVVALDRLTLEVPHGAIFGFLGPNGAGKTTLLRLLTGLAYPTAGSATVAGFDVTSGSVELRRRISLLDQSPDYYGWLSGRELLELVGELSELPRAELRSRVDEVLALTGLSDVARRRVGGYSGGMRQRLGLAQALVNRPQVLLLDEPASSLDPGGRHDILQVIASLRGSATVFMASHILSDVERVCDAVAIVDHGRLIVSSSVEKLQEQYAQPIFVLEPEPNQQGATERLVATLKAAPWAGEVRYEQGVIRVLARDTAAAAREILPLVASLGAQLLRFERARPSLEDIFLRLTGAQAEKATGA